MAAAGATATSRPSSSPLFDPLAEAGFVWFSINYRLAPAHRFPAPVDDVESAVRWVRAHAREYKVDTRRLAIMGESAGGHLVAFVGARDGRKLGLAAVVSFYGPHELETLAASRAKTPAALESLQALLDFQTVDDAARRKLRVASPATYVAKGMPPFLLIHGTADPLVPFQQSVDMCDRMRKAGAACELYPVEGATHGIGGWEKNPAFQSYKRAMVDWLRRTLK